MAKSRNSLTQILTHLKKILPLVEKKLKFFFVIYFNLKENEKSPLAKVYFD